MIERFSGDFLQWLRGFYAVAECGSMSQAAEMLGLRQPAVSYLVQSLEAELGVQLFYRRNKSLELTVEGRQLYEKAVTMFELVKEIRSEVGSVKETEYKGEISLSASHSISVNILADPLARFHQKYPKTWFTLNAVGVASVTLDMVNNSSIDFGILASNEFPGTIVAQPFFSTRLALACSRDMSFSRDEKGCLKDLTELNGKPFVAFSTQSILTHAVEELLKKYGVSPSVVMTANNFAIILAYVRSGMGVTLVEEFTARAYEGMLDIYPLNGEEAVREYCLITRKKKRLSPQSIACIDMLIDEMHLKYNIG